MKNDMMIASWDRILPDEATNERMLSNIMEYHKKYVTSSAAKTVKKLLPLAACFVLAIAAAAFWGIRNDLVGAKSYTVTLESGESFVYGRTKAIGEACYAYEYEVTERQLTADELREILPTIELSDANGLPHAVFKAETGEMERIGLIADDIHINLARKGLPLTDVIISGNESTAEINGVTVKTGYSRANPNRPESRRLVFFSEFTIDETSVYLELAGDEKESVQLTKKLSETVLAMINGGAPDINAVKY